MNQLGYIDVREFGAKGDGQADDTKAIQDAFNAANSLPGVTVFVPPGEYMVGSLNAQSIRAVDFGASNCKLTGGGTFKYRLGCNNNAVLRISGDNNSIEWIRVDCNWSGGAAATSGYRDNGKYNRSRDIVAFNVAPGPDQGDPQGDCLQHMGEVGTMHRCIALGGYTSLRDAGDYNVMQYCLGLEYARKGYNNSFKFTTWTCVIGVHTESTYVSTTGAAGYQIDPEAENATFDRAIFRDCTGRPETEPGTTNGTKFAVIKDVYFDGCQVFHTTTTVTTFRVAERVDRVRVKDSFLARDFFFESMLTPYPEEARLERVIIGDGTQDPNYAVGRGRCDILKIADSVLNGYTLGGIEWCGPDGTYTLIATTNCEFNGKKNNDTTFDIDPTSVGLLNHSRKLQWLGNRRSNSGTGTASAQFTDPNDSDNILGTTQDASTRVYAHSAAPTSNLVTWAIGDIVMNTSPASLGYIGWVCTSATPSPGTWKQWGAIS